MSGEFKFKYLDGSYVKRLQHDASKKLHQGHNEGEIKPILKNADGSVKSTIPEGNDSKHHENDQNDRNRSSEVVYDAAEFKNKITSLSLNKTYIRSEVPRARYNSSGSEIGHNCRISQQMTPKQTKIDENESILARITSSQRAICTAIDSLAPNIVEKPQFETPSDADRCRKRFEAFLRMFTRNYSYPIELMLSDIQTSLTYSPSSLAFKINSLYNILQVAVSAYTTNVRNYLDHGIPPKLMELLNSVRQTTFICVERMLFDEEDCVVQFVLDKMDEVLMDLESISLGKLDYLKKVKNIKVNAAIKQENRLCMYGLPSNQIKTTQKPLVHSKQTKKDKEIPQTARV